MSFFETIRDWLGSGLIDIAEWLICHNHINLAQKLLRFVIKDIYGRDPDHEHSWRITYVDGDPVMQCSTCGRKLQGDSLLEGIIKKKEMVIERLKEITDGIPDDLDGESAKQKLLQVRDSLTGILEHLE